MGLEIRKDSLSPSHCTIHGPIDVTKLRVGEVEPSDGSGVDSGIPSELSFRGSVFRVLAVDDQCANPRTSRALGSLLDEGRFAVASVSQKLRDHANADATVLRIQLLESSRDMAEDSFTRGLARGVPP